MGTNTKYVLICENGEALGVTRADIHHITSVIKQPDTAGPTLLLHQPFVASGTRLFCFN